jgi:hypothetical protein
MAITFIKWPQSSRNLDANHSTFRLVAVEAFLHSQLGVNAKNLLCIALRPHLRAFSLLSNKAFISPYGAEFAAGELRFAPLVEKSA